MASFDPAPAGQPSQTTIAKPFRFLDLPAEIRNKVYDFVLCGRESNFRLNKIAERTDTSHSSIGLAEANKQLHAEFGPLRASNMGYIVPLIDYPAFVATFFGPNSEYPRPLRVRIEIGLSGVDYDFSWDMKPLMLAKATTSGLRLTISKEGGCCDISPYLFSIAWLSGGRAHGSLRAWGHKIARALRRDVKSGYISTIQFNWMQTRCERPTWLLVIKKKKGGLRDEEVRRCESYCSVLRWMFSSLFDDAADITIKVTDLEGSHVEEWNTYGQLPMAKKSD
jgi:hypothetical protein